MKYFWKYALKTLYLHLLSKLGVQSCENLEYSILTISEIFLSALRYMNIFLTLPLTVRLRTMSTDCGKKSRSIILNQPPQCFTLSSRSFTLMNIANIHQNYFRLDPTDRWVDPVLSAIPYYDKHSVSIKSSDFKALLELILMYVYCLEYQDMMTESVLKFIQTCWSEASSWNSHFIIADKAIQTHDWGLR